MYDLHTHFIPSDVYDWLKENSRTIHAQFEQKDAAKSEFLTINGKWSFELKPLFLHAELYLNSQREAGVSHSLVSPIPQLFLYEFPSEITNELADVYNRSLADWTASQPDRLSALATVPLQNPAKAADQLKAACKNRLKGAIIGPGCGGQMLTDDFFVPFWEAAEETNAIVFIHPLLSEDARLQRRMMPNLIGVPWETTVCATDILLSGLLDKYPHAKILLAHGGGFLPYQIGRLDKGYNQWKPVSAALQAPPSEYLKRFWYDSVLWNQAALEYLLLMAGEDRIVPGSDFPFDLCAWPPKQFNEKGVQSLMGN
ncbi:amidohydrolase family protein [Effusibacillus dendaii]|uniref:Amidohydrolase n=1 Tax=Effusibacillus dendaii TaxID=2743772 RepID=A0A7I8DGD3_9BACL|nr:amidohydrolase family protein [Effusibacillus dendaii]BCJ88402.1 amidohydrolase [Effusibacillus dendaii]